MYEEILVSIIISEANKNLNPKVVKPVKPNIFSIIKNTMYDALLPKEKCIEKSNSLFQHHKLKNPAISSSPAAPALQPEVKK